MNKFKKYKFLKTKLMVQNAYDYPLEMVLGSYLANLVWLKKPLKLRFVIYCILYDYDFTTNSKTLITHLSKRSSYVEFLKNYIINNNFSPNTLATIIERRRSIYEILSFIFQFLKNSKYDKDLTYFEMIAVSFLITYGLITIKNLEAKKMHCEKYFALNSSYLFESFLTYYFRKRQVKTFSFSHALYYKYKNEIPFDVINYENICAENLLCWGDHSIDEIKNEIPSGVNLIKDSYPYDFSVKEGRLISDKILIILPRDIYFKEIVDLLNIIKLSKNSYIVRPHPSLYSQIKKIISNISNMELDRNEELNETLSSTKYSYCLGFNSTALIEAALYEQKIVQYISGNDEFIISSVDNFSNLNEYIENNYNESKNNELDIKYYFNI
jgi:hypothetical protein